METFKRKDLFKFIRCTMYFADMYSPHLEHQLPRKLGVLLELIFEMFLYFVAIHIAILYVITMYLNLYKGDLELLVNCLMQTIIYLWTILMKLYFRRLQRERLEDLIDFINSKYKARSAIGFTYVTMKESFDMSNKWIKMYVNSCFLCAICWLVVPIAYGDRSLPLACWYPFDYKQPIIYEIIYFLQFVAQIQVAASFSSSSGLHMVLSILISGQYDILYCSLKNILTTVAINRNASNAYLRTPSFTIGLWTAVEGVKSFIEINKSNLNDGAKFDMLADFKKQAAYLVDALPAGKLRQMQENETPEVNEYYCSTEMSCYSYAPTHTGTNVQHGDFRYYFRNAFKQCLDHHCFIKECLNKMEKFYSPVWFFKTGEVIFLMCLVAFVSVKSSANSSLIKMISLGQYLLMVALEFLVVCYFGEIIYINSQRCVEAIMRSPWYIYLAEIKSDFNIFMLIAKKPFYLTAGRIYALNIELFKVIMTTAFSFLTFLQNMDERNK